MSSPRRVARIQHKAARLMQRAGYGVPGVRRRAARKDYGPFPVESSSPCVKRAHDTYTSAEKHIEALRATGDPHGDRLRAYECPDCQFIHVGHAS